MHVSLKVVIVALMLVTSCAVIVCSFLTVAVRLQFDLLDFVTERSIADGDVMQHLLSHRLRRMETACHVLFRAGSAQDLLGELDDVWKFADWAGPIVAQLDIGAGLLLPDGRGIRVSSQNDATFLQGYVLITNITSPGVFADVGQFQLYTHAPAASQQPWTRVYTDVEWKDVAAAADVTNPNRSSPMQWAKVSPLNIYPSWTTESMLVIGGPVVVGSAVDPAKRLQFLFLEHRGEWLTQYFSEVKISDHAAALLIDVATGAFVAGSISDPTGTTSDDGVPHLQLVRDLNDERIRSFLSACVVSSHEALIGANGSQAIFRCHPPCVLTYWPSENEIRDETQKQQPRAFAAFGNSFTVVRVVQVSDPFSRLDMLNLRLVVATPSDDIVGELIDRVGSTGVYLIVAAVASGLIVISAVTILLRDLSGLEAEMLRMTKVFSPTALSTNVLLQSEPTDGDEKSETKHFALQFPFLADFSRISVSLRMFSRDLRTIRAFSSESVVTSICSATPMATAAPSLDASPAEASLNATSHTRVVSPSAAQPSPQNKLQLSGMVEPYSKHSQRLWRVPVTTVAMIVNTSFLGGPRDDPAHVHQRQFAVVNVLRAHAAGISGSCFVDTFTGDNLLLHFNAVARTPKHVVAALKYIFKCQKSIDRAVSALPLARTSQAIKNESHENAVQPVYFGVAASVAHCGTMGPTSLLSFNVVSPGVTQAAFMSRIAMSRNRLTMITWRAVEAARQQQTLSHNPNTSQIRVDDSSCAADVFVFTPTVHVVFPGVSHVPSVAYAVSER
jgi:hypothetical protein